MKYGRFLTAFLACLSAHAADQKLAVPVDSESDYSVVSITDSAEYRLAIVKRVAAGEATYIKQAFYCETGATQLMSNASSLEGLNNTTSSTPIFKASRGAVSQYLAPQICSLGK